MRILPLAAVLALAAFSAGAQAATTTVTALLDGQPSLLGWQHEYQPGANSHITTLSDGELEYLSADYTLGIDLFSSGLIQLYNNSGTAQLAGATLTLDFAGLPSTITGITLGDTNELSAGTVSAKLLNPHSVSISFDTLSFTNDSFPSFSLQLSLAPVPEPASMLMLALGLAVLSACAARVKEQRA